ncbi:MAG: hypothetical protein AAFV45_03555 [Pseudomonadota bacterium]
MIDLFTDGRFVDYVLAFILIEFLVLVAIRLFSGQGVALASYSANVASGGSLMLCLREALHDARPLVMAAFLLLSGIAHAIDVWSRWNR